MALNNDLYEYFLGVPESEREESIDRLRTELKDVLSADAIKMVIEAVCRALGWREVLRAGSDEEIIEDAKNYFSIWGNSKQECERIFRLLKKAANRGNAEAQNWVGVCYYSGKGTMKDHEKALEWFRKAAENGDAAAACNLGSFYKNGDCTLERNEKLAIYWYTKAEERGNKNATVALACILK